MLYRICWFGIKIPPSDKREEENIKSGTSQMQTVFRPRCSNIVWLGTARNQRYDEAGLGFRPSREIQSKVVKKSNNITNSSIRHVHSEFQSVEEHRLKLGLEDRHVLVFVSNVFVCWTTFDIQRFIPPICHRDSRCPVASWSLTSRPFFSMWYQIGFLGCNYVHFREVWWAASLDPSHLDLTIKNRL